MRNLVLGTASESSEATACGGNISGFPAVPFFLCVLSSLQQNQAASRKYPRTKSEAPSGGGRYIISPATLHTLISSAVDPFSSNGPSWSHLRFCARTAAAGDHLRGREQLLELIFIFQQKNDNTWEFISLANLMRHRHRAGPVYKQTRPQFNFNLIEIME